ncbi:MAG: CBS domain-containing protein [Nanoarchaeota archaeon]|nr:CBS domain-containing protein [Nanoarchaeota archaeon]
MIQLQDIKTLRRKFNLTQGELAKKANVSQSLIAKIEAGRIDPAYTKAKQIFNTLELLDKKQEIKIKDFMCKRITSVKSACKIKDVIKKIRKLNISQLPVIENNITIGLVSESSILEKISSIENPSKITQLTVKDVMKEPPPSIPITTSQKVASSLLKHFPMLLVTKKGKIVGIITKADLLGRIV